MLLDRFTHKLEIGKFEPFKNWTNNAATYLNRGLSF